MTDKEIDIWNKAIEAALYECSVSVQRKKHKYGSGERDGFYTQLRNAHEISAAIALLKKHHGIGGGDE